MRKTLGFVAEKLYEWSRENTAKAVIVLTALAVFDGAALFRVAGGAPDIAGAYFLDVGQGDSELVIFSDGVKLLVDGGPPEGGAHEILGNIFPPGDRYIDLIMMSHPQLDHYGGFTDIVRRYRVGAFISNGETAESEAFKTLALELAARNIPKISLRAGDAIRHGGDVFAVLSPEHSGEGASPNDDALVGELVFSGARIFFAADADERVEKRILTGWSGPTDILKVAHHGSKYGTSAMFLAAAHPRAAVIEVGKNGYGHPAPATIARLTDSGARIFRTDENGTLRFIFDGHQLRIYSLDR